MKFYSKRGERLAAHLALGGLVWALGGCDSEERADSDSSAAMSTQGATDGSDGEDTDGADSTSGSSDGSDSDGSDSDGSSNSDGSTTASSSDTSQETTASSSGGGSTGDDGGSTGGSDSGGGATGLEGFCERYFECGGSYYSDVESCMDASLGYWGECTEAVAALDAFGDCMITIPCEDYNPDAYNPANTDCADQWQEVTQSSC